MNTNRSTFQSQCLKLHLRVVLLCEVAQGTEGGTQFSLGMFLHIPKSTRWSQQVFKKRKSYMIKHVFYQAKSSRITE